MKGVCSMELGTFYIALNVKDLKASRAFYEKLGFSVFDGKEEENWLMLRNGETKIGLFQGMFEQNLLTFHPADVRSIQKTLKEAGVALTTEADETTTGPAHATLVDPDGNPILIDQF
jgi:predicted lactoylglutathione lyase